MKFSIQFEIPQEPASKKFGLRLIAVDTDGKAIGSAPLCDAIFSSASEALDTLSSAFRGAILVRRPGVASDEFGLNRFLASTSTPSA